MYSNFKAKSSNFISKWYFMARGMMEGYMIILPLVNEIDCPNWISSQEAEKRYPLFYCVIKDIGNVETLNKYIDVMHYLR